MTEIRNAVVSILILLILVSTPAIGACADQPATTSVKFNSNYTAAHVTVVINGVRKEFDFKTSPSGPEQATGTFSILSWNSKQNELTLGDSYGRRETVSKLPYPQSVTLLLAGKTSIHIHLSAAAWLAADIALVLAIIAVILSYFVTGFNCTTVLNLLLAAFVNINSFILRDRNTDRSLDLWAPVDWYNTSKAILNHCIYVATPHYWWLVFSKITEGIPQIVATR
jgi:hypothetical protein